MTKLVRDHSAGAYAVSVPCYLDECKGPRRMVQLSDAVIDLDGTDIPLCADCVRLGCMRAATAGGA